MLLYFQYKALTLTTKPQLLVLHFTIFICTSNVFQNFILSSLLKKILKKNFFIGSDRSRGDVNDKKSKLEKVEIFHQIEQNLNLIYTETETNNDALIKPIPIITTDTDNFISLIFWWLLCRCPKSGWGYPSNGLNVAINECKADKNWNMTSIEDCVSKWNCLNC